MWVMDRERAKKSAHATLKSGIEQATTGLPGQKETQCACMHFSFLASLNDDQLQTENPAQPDHKGPDPRGAKSAFANQFINRAP
jgi:hypothetical protein